MRAGADRAGGLTEVVRAQLVRRQDHPNTGRDARMDHVARCLSQKLTAETAEKRKQKKEKCGSSRHGEKQRPENSMFELLFAPYYVEAQFGAKRSTSFLGHWTTAKVIPTYHSVVVFPSIAIDLPLRVYCSV